MTEYVVRFLVGGAVVSAFAMLGDMLRPKSFAGLFGAAPSVALATLGIAVYQHGAGYAALQSHTMMAGAVALAVYSVVVCHLLVRAQLGAAPATLLSLVVWLIVAIGLLTLVYGPAAFRKRGCAWVAEVADMYPACLIGSRAVALMGIRTHRWSH
jgi:Protein of unknown function (DUF3147)